LSVPTSPIRKTKDRAVCLVKNETGYTNLCRLITQRHRDPAFELAKALPQRADGLLILTSQADLLARWHRAGVHTAAALARRPPSPFHPLIQTARKLKIPLVATPDSFFTEPDDYAVHRLLRAIEGNTSFSRLDADVIWPPRCLAGPAGQLSPTIRPDPRSRESHNGPW
jgi:DNA polymerase III alpha subunit